VVRRITDASAAAAMTGIVYLGTRGILPQVIATWIVSTWLPHA
jgi:hypothetical protein